MSVSQELSKPRPRMKATAQILSWRTAVFTILLLALFLAPVYLQNEYAVRILVLVCIYGVASTGWNLLGGFANQISLGHTAFFGIGAYAAIIFQTTLASSPWLGMLTGIAVSVAVAFLVGWPTFQLSGHYFALATLALLPVFNIVASYWSDLTGGPPGMAVPRSEEHTV